MKKLLVLGFLTSALFASDAFADIAVDPCTGLAAGDVCTVDAGGTRGTCVDLDGSLECQAAPNATNNATGNATNNAQPDNNATNNATNNDTTPPPTTTEEPTDPDKSEEVKDEGGCTTASGNGLLSILMGLALVTLGRVRR